MALKRILSRTLANIKNMKIVSVLTILTIFAFTTVFGQLNEYHKVNTQLIDNMKSLIETNKPELIYDRANDDFRSKIKLEELETIISSINKLLKDHSMKGLNSNKKWFNLIS